MSGGAFVKVPGTPIQLGDDWYVMPPLTIGVLEQLNTDGLGELLAANFSMEQVRKVIDLLHASLLRNYPGLPRETLTAHLDLGSIEPAARALLKTSGLTKEARDPDEEDIPPGEARANEPAAGST